MASRDRRATLAHVAASAGVSVATVSKVLNGRNDVAPATRALVQELLHEHDYVARRVRPSPSSSACVRAGSAAPRRTVQPRGPVSWPLQVARRRSW